MKVDALYRPELKSGDPPSGLMFRVAQMADSDAITRLMSERNPKDDLLEIGRKTSREIELNNSDPKYRLFVAELNGKILGLCRYFHSDGLPKEKLRFPAPNGWYCMGILVDQNYRRQGIARFLFRNRLLSLSEKGAKTIYSMTDAENLASIKMHQEFGFKEIERGPGFLQIGFDNFGILYRMDL